MSAMTDDGAELHELHEAEQQILREELRTDEPVLNNCRHTMTSRPESNRRLRVDELMAAARPCPSSAAATANAVGIGAQQPDGSTPDPATANELQLRLEIERLDRGLKLAEENARLANLNYERAAAENKALHSEVKKLQWQKLMSKTPQSTKVLAPPKLEC